MGEEETEETSVSHEEPQIQNHFFMRSPISLRNLEVGLEVVECLIQESMPSQEAASLFSNKHNSAPYIRLRSSYLSLFMQAGLKPHSRQALALAMEGDVAKGMIGEVLNSTCSCAE